MIKILNSRNQNQSITPQRAIIDGLADNGGLYTLMIEDLNIDINSLLNKTYKQRALIILKHLLYDFDEAKLKQAIDKAYDEKFDDQDIAPVKSFGNVNFLELFHGPTNAFKDMALSILPYLLKISLNAMDNQKDVFIMTATSGDTGKAAIEAFKNVDGTYINVLYPKSGVSPIQKQQMVTSLGNNVDVLAIDGNFDDCQNLVKQCNLKLKAQNYPINFSSANSINYGRLVPQVVYYFDSYCKMIETKQIDLGEQITYIVPTGNFGNILAGYIAKQMGCPIKHLVCASNDNDVLVDFINTGTYDINRHFHKTHSPSMDILISSNLERLLFMLSDGDSQKLNQYMTSLKKTKQYRVDDEMMHKINEHFISYRCSDEQCLRAIGDCFKQYDYLIDPHTACGYHSYLQYQKVNPDVKCMVLATASAYKFAQSSLMAINHQVSDDCYQAMSFLSQLTKTAIPNNLDNLAQLPINFNKTLKLNDVYPYFEHKIKELIND